MKKTYITTSIAYTNAPAHVGHALELIQADVIARHQRSLGKEVFFLTGTDEHGIKIARKAQEQNKDVQEFCDEISNQFRKLAKELNVSNDDFIRTTDKEKHWPGVFEIWQKMEEKGDIYQQDYHGLYCVGCEAFIMEKDLVDGQCPYHDKKPEKVQEKNYFFRLSKYSDQIKKAIEDNSIEIIPESRKKEILSFLKKGLNDVSFSRPKEKVSWGIPVPGDQTQSIYCWADALTNYVSAIGYGRNDDYLNYWPADIHFIGKDISKFHALIWPGILLSAGLSLPKKIFIHGFLTVNGKKMSKSLGNVVDPFDLINQYKADAVRYYFLSEVSPTEDGDYSEEKFKDKYNAELAGGIGNLVARTITLAEKIEIKENFEIKERVVQEVEKVQKRKKELLEDFKFNSCLAEIQSLVKFSDQLIEENKPWQEEREDRAEIVFNLLFILENLASLLDPFMPETSAQILEQTKTKEKKVLFPRVH
jgi:methionyl-tRNA synthetase